MEAKRHLFACGLLIAGVFTSGLVAPAHGDERAWVNNKLSKQSPMPPGGFESAYQYDSSYLDDAPEPIYQPCNLESFFPLKDAVTESDIRVALRHVCTPERAFLVFFSARSAKDLGVSGAEATQIDEVREDYFRRRQEIFNASLASIHAIKPERVLTDPEVKERNTKLVSDTILKMNALNFEIAKKCLAILNADQISHIMRAHTKSTCIGCYLSPFMSVYLGLSPDQVSKLQRLSIKERVAIKEEYKDPDPNKYMRFPNRIVRFSYQVWSCLTVDQIEKYWRLEGLLTENQSIEDVVNAMDARYAKPLCDAVPQLQGYRTN